MRKIIIAFLVTMMAASFVAADTIYLRDGRTIRGTVLGFLDGRFVVRLSGSQSGGQAAAGSTGDGGEIQYFDPQDIQRIEIDGRSLDEARFQTRTVNVTLGPDWIDSGVYVRRGQRVRVRASGIIEAGRRRISPAGLRSTDPNAPLPNAPEGELIGAITNDPNAPIMEFGTSREFVADNDGDLFFTINRGDYSDVRGSYNVQVMTDRTAPSNDSSTGAFGNNGGGSRAARTPREVSITVPGNSQGTDTGIDLRAGDQVTITATGTVNPGPRVGNVTPDGGRVGFGALFGQYPVANAGPGALVAYIRQANGQNTAPFLIGSQQTFTSPTDGRLVLLINDDDYSDNTGSFTARIRY